MQNFRKKQKLVSQGDNTISNIELRGLVGRSFFIFQECTCCRSMTSLFHHEKAVKLLGFIIFYAGAKIVCPFYF